jgi:acetate kinase
VGLARLRVSRVLVVNAGSTSLKLSVVDENESSQPVETLEGSPDVDAVVHRVVHGGDRFADPVVIDDTVRAALGGLTELAPLHNAPALEAIDDALLLLSGVPHLAVFDTAFHRTMPLEAVVYALPRRWREDFGLRRYGFHGLSVQWAAERVPVPRLVVCHLGGGCSVTAVLDGRSVDTTMGFSPLEGVPMATRAGSIDAEAILHLLRTGRADIEEIERVLERESGLLGLSGESARVEELEASGAASAGLALDVFTLRVAGAVAAMTASLEGLDALVFTGGVGEGSARVRADVCARLRALGVELDPRLNAAGRPDTTVGAADATVDVVIVRAREDVVAARSAWQVLATLR